MPGITCAVATDGITHRFEGTKIKDRIKENAEAACPEGIPSGVEAVLQFDDEDLMLKLENVRLQIVDWIRRRRSNTL